MNFEGGNIWQTGRHRAPSADPLRRSVGLFGRLAHCVVAGCYELAFGHAPSQFAGPRYSVPTVKVQLLTIAACVFCCSPATASDHPKVAHRAQQISIHTSPPIHPTERGSFLGALVYTVPDLLAQVETHPAIAKRYAMHYGMAPSVVISYFKSNLVESYMPRTEVFQTYWVRPNGAIRSGSQYLTKGTRVFALRNGEPVLKWACGNPLTSSLPAVLTKVESAEAVFDTRLQPTEQILLPADTTDVYVPSEAPDAVVASEGPDTLTFSEQAATASTRFPVWQVLAAAPIIYTITHGGGGSTPPVAPAPEVPSGAAFAALAGFGALVIRRRKKATD